MLEKKGVLWNALGSTMYGINSFVMLVLVSRIGTVEQAGYFGIAFTTAQMLYFLGVFGVSHYQMTDYTETYSFSDYARLRIFSSVLMMLCCAAAVFGLGFTGEKCAYTISLSILMLLNAIGDLYQCMFFQKNRLDISGAALFFRTLWSLTAFSLSLLISRSIILAVCSQILVNLLVTLYYAIGVAPRYISRKAESKKNAVFALARECFPLFISLLLMNLFLSAPKYGIELFSDDAAQGYFSMIFMPVQGINLCSQFVFRPMLGSYSKALRENRIKDFLHILFKQLLFVLGLTLVVAVGAFLFGTPVLGFVYTKDLSSLSLPLALLMLGAGFYACNELFYLIMIMLRRQLLILEIYVLCMVFSAGVIYILVPLLGIMGASLAFLMSQFLLLVSYGISMTHSLYTKQKEI